MIKKYLIVSYTQEGKRFVHDRCATMDDARTSLQVIKSFVQSVSTPVTDVAIEMEVLTGRE